MGEKSKSLLENIKSYASERSKELKKLAQTELTIDQVEANIAGQKIAFKANVERIAAWRLYVELSTRITTQEIRKEEGLLREALTSLYNMFEITRRILKEAGPAVAQGKESLGFYAMAILNMEIRPFLAYWHPRLQHWEAQNKDMKISALEHEEKWGENATVRKALEELRNSLLQYCDALATLAGLSD